MDEINTSISLISSEDRLLTKRMYLLIIPALILGSIINLIYVKKLLGIICMATIVLFKGSNLTTVLFGIKPLMDLTWDATYFSISGFSVNSLRIIGVIMMFIWGYIYLYKKKEKVKNIQVINLFFIYLVFSSMAKAIFTSDTAFIISTLIRLVRIFDGFLLYIVAVTIYSEANKKIRVISVIWLSHLFVMVLNIIVFLRGNYSIDISQGVQRYNSVYNDPGGPALVALVAVVFSILYVNFEKRTLPKSILIAYIFTHAIALFTLYLTLTRGVIVLFIILYLIWYAYYKKKLFLMVPIFILASYFLYTTDFRIRSRFENEISFMLSKNRSIAMAENLGDGRIAHNIRYLKVFNKNFNTFEKIFGKSSYGVHNEYLSFLFEFGLLGLFFYFLLIVMFLYTILEKYIKISRYDNQNKTLGILSIIILSMWITGALWGSFIDYTTFWWSLVLIISLFLNSKKNIIQDDKLIDS